MEVSLRMWAPHNFGFPGSLSLVLTRSHLLGEMNLLMLKLSCHCNVNINLSNTVNNNDNNVPV